MKYTFLILVSLILWSCTDDSPYKNQNVEALGLMNSFSGNGLIGNLEENNDQFAVTYSMNDASGAVDFTAAKVGSSQYVDVNGYANFAESNEKNVSSKIEKAKGSKIIKKGSLTLEIKDIDSAKPQMDSLVNSLDAYFENEHFTDNGYRKTYALVIRVPAAKFDLLIYALENGSGEIKAKNITAEDVSEEYMDLNIRLKNKRAYLLQYQTILKKANSIKEILEVKEKIRDLQEEIESKMGRIKFLDDKVSYSTIQIEMFETFKQERNKKSFFSRITKGISGGFSGFLSFVVFMVYQWPLVIFFLVVWFFRKRLFKRFRKKNS